jgi:hypothetical protein
VFEVADGQLDLGVGAVERVEGGGVTGRSVMNGWYS